jgi:hypothetical protein
VVLLEKVKLNNIVPHCLGILHKIDRQVGLKGKERQVMLCLQVLPRTMSMALHGYWKQVVQEYDEAHKDSITTLDKFNLVLQTFFAGHATEDDHHDLLESLCLAIKLKMMKVQTFFYCIKEMNDCMEWLPGHEEKLSESQLNLAFYNRLPGSWRAKYMIAG